MEHAAGRCPPVTAAAAPDWVKLARELKPAVVNIGTRRIQVGLPGLPGPFGSNDPFQQFFGQFFGNVPRREVHSLGSGFIINPDGYIVTNNHVVDNAKEIRVKLADGRELAGRVIGEGPYDDFIQTDASINPGNSGGPLIDARGQAIGINTAIFSQSGGSVGIGFAMPINLAKPVVTQLAEHGRVVRGWLGVSIQPVTPELAKAMNLSDTHGALVSSVVEDSPAIKAGLRAGDVVVEYDGHRVGQVGELPRAVAETPVGREVPLTVVRDGKSLRLVARIARLEEPVEAAGGPAAPGTPQLGLQVQPLTPPAARELGLTDQRGAS